MSNIFLFLVYFKVGLLKLPISSQFPDCTHVCTDVCCRCKDSVKHFPLCWDGSNFVFGFGKFANVYELMKHFNSSPVIGGDAGMQTGSHMWYAIIISV